MNATDLSGRCALVTGGARGIGKAVALMLAGAGANVAVNYRQREQDARSVVDAVGRLGRRALAVQADVSDGTAVKAMMGIVEGGLGRVDILVNNAGVAAPSRARRVDGG